MKSCLANQSSNGNQQENYHCEHCCFTAASQDNGAKIVNAIPEISSFASEATQR